MTQDARVNQPAESAKAIPYLDMLLWTGVVAAVATGCLWLMEHEWPRVLGPLYYSRSFSSAIDMLFGIYLFASAFSLLPALTGYVMGAMRALTSQPERPMHASDRVAYRTLCMGLALALLLETALYAPSRLFPDWPLGIGRLVVVLAPGLLPFILWGWSIVVAIRLGSRP